MYNIRERRVPRGLPQKKKEHTFVLLQENRLSLGGRHQSCEEKKSRRRGVLFKLYSEVVPVLKGKGSKGPGKKKTWACLTQMREEGKSAAVPKQVVQRRGKKGTFFG